MLDHAEFDRWRLAADEAGRGASVQADAGLNNWACFLAEQAAQLAMKGLLHGIGAGAWGHDVVKLGEAIALSMREALPGNVRDAVLRLSRHYIPARYPDAHPSGAPGAHYGEEDARQALSDMRTILATIDDLWSRLVRRAADDTDLDETDRGT